MVQRNSINTKITYHFVLNCSIVRGESLPQMNDRMEIYTVYTLHFN